MITLSLVLFFVACASSKQPETNKLHPFSLEAVDQINSVQNLWTAKQHFTEEDFINFRTKLGVLEDKNGLPEVNATSHFKIQDSEIPESFDVREQWPACSAIMNDIRDQANCGSCWAFGATGSMSDRICIESKGQKLVHVSPDDLLSCCGNCGMGCRGGYPNRAWNYWKTKGIVTGDNFGDKSECRPYEIEPCGHGHKKCRGTARTPRCARKCVNGKDYNSEKLFGSKVYALSGENNIKKELMQHGSVEVTFAVMRDFPQYSGGVYKATTNERLGLHAVRLIGWGVDNGTPYWTVANSWSDAWGEKGFFRILRGKNHCGIEGTVNTGLPKL